MFLKTANMSIRTRFVIWAILGACVVTLAAGAVILLVSHSHLYGRVYDDMERLVRDLTREYQELGGICPEFIHCVDQDVHERDANAVRISILNSEGAELYATPPLRSGDDEIVIREEELVDGCRIVVIHDTEDIFDYMKFLLITMSVLMVASVAISGAGAYFIGGRILRLNDLMADKDRAYAELRHLTDDIAHDLRTPLTRLSMAAETDMSGGVQRESLPVQVMNECGAMLDMINTMLAISQTESRISRSPREEIDISEFAHNICELYSSVAEDAGVNLVADIPASPVPFSGHKAKLQQLVGNLLDNALKFTGRGGRIEVGLQGGNGEVVISVSDTGCGIAEADIPFIFNRFWRADSSRHLPGNGLGLALVRAIAVSYGGRVECKSALGKGTVFTVVLPSGIAGA